MHRGALTEEELRILARGGFNIAGGMEEGDSRLSGQEELDALMQTSLSVEAASERLSVPASDLRQRLDARPPRLYGIRRGSDWCIPEFQFNEAELIPGIGEVVAHLDPGLHPVAIYRWFATPNPDLLIEEENRSVSPRDWLRFGLPVEAVVDLAKDLGYGLA